VIINSVSLVILGLVRILVCYAPNRKMHLIIRVISVISYCFIYIWGWMIAVPLGCILIFGILDAEPVTRVLLILADLALISLFIFSFTPRSKISVFIEIVTYLLLLAPLIRMLSGFPLSTFNYSLFVFPFASFTLLFPLSIFLSNKNYLNNRKQRRIT
jgi:hypothetical protein